MNEADEDLREILSGTYRDDGRGGQGRDSGGGQGR